MQEVGFTQQSVGSPFRREDFGFLEFLPVLLGFTCKLSVNVVAYRDGSVALQCTLQSLDCLVGCRGLSLVVHLQQLLIFQSQTHHGRSQIFAEIIPFVCEVMNHIRSNPHCLLAHGVKPINACIFNLVRLQNFRCLLLSRACVSHQSFERRCKRLNNSCGQADIFIAF